MCEECSTVVRFGGEKKPTLFIGSGMLTVVFRPSVASFFLGFWAAAALADADFWFNTFGMLEPRRIVGNKTVEHTITTAARPKTLFFIGRHIDREKS